MAQRFPLGTQFKPVGRKHAKVCTVIDYWVTRNTVGDVVKERYVALHDSPLGPVTDYDVVETTIARGLIPN